MLSLCSRERCERIVMSVFVCMSVRSHISETTEPNFTELFMRVALPATVARSSSDGTAIRRVLPVLWMASCFHVTARFAWLYDQSQRTPHSDEMRSVKTRSHGVRLGL